MVNIGGSGLNFFKIPNLLQALGPCRRLGTIELLLQLNEGPYFVPGYLASPFA